MSAHDVYHCLLATTEKSLPPVHVYKLVRGSPKGGLAAVWTRTRWGEKQMFVEAVYH